MSSYGYDSSYGYYGYYSYYGSFGGYSGSGAVAELSGPGSSAYTRTAYHGSYAYESPRGGVYTSDFTYYRNGFVSHTSYTYAGPDTTYKGTSTYTDYGSHTAASPYSLLLSYYSTYYLPYGYTTTEDRQTYGVYHYVGNNEYLESSISDSAQTSEGYTFSTYIHSTFERTDGSFDSGSATQYYAKSLYGPYGTVSFESHTSHF